VGFFYLGIYFFLKSPQTSHRNPRFGLIFKVCKAQRLAARYDHEKESRYLGKYPYWGVTVQNGLESMTIPLSSSGYFLRVRNFPLGIKRDEKSWVAHRTQLLGLRAHLWIFEWSGHKIRLSISSSHWHRQARECMSANCAISKGDGFRRLPPLAKSRVPNAKANISDPGRSTTSACNLQRQPNLVYWVLRIPVKRWTISVRQFGISILNLLLIPNRARSGEVEQNNRGCGPDECKRT